MNKKQVIINYLREQTYETVINLLNLNLTRDELLQEVGLLRLPYLGSDDNRKVIQYLNTRVSLLTYFDFRSVYLILSSHRIEEQGVSDELKKAHIDYMYQYLYDSASDKENLFDCIDSLITEQGYRTDVSKDFYKRGLLAEHKQYFINLRDEGIHSELWWFNNHALPKCKLRDDIWEILGHINKE